MKSNKKNSEKPEHLQPQAAVYVCVRDRHGKGASCAGSGSREMLARMKQMLAAEQIGADELALRPCGCLGLCKQGPVLLTAQGAAVAQKKPRKPKNKHAKNVYTRVSDGQTRDILRQALMEAARENQKARPT